MGFSLVIITRDRLDHLRQLCESLQALEGREAIVETIVVDDGSRDQTPAFLDSREALQVVRHEESRGPAASRNQGIRLARAPLVWFLDDDVVVDRGALRAYVEHARQHSLATSSATGPVEQRPDGRTSFEYWLCNGGSQFIHDHVDPSRRLDAGEEQFCTCNLVAPAGLLKGELFDESFRYPRYEDRELSYRLARKYGHKIHLVDGARVIHMKRYRFHDWLKAYRIFTECALHFASLHPTDAALKEKLHIGRAERTATYRREALEMAVRLLNGEHTVDFGESQPGFGGEWMRDSVFGSYRVIQEFFRQSFLREQLGLEPCRDENSGLPANEMCSWILAELRPGL